MKFGICLPIEQSARAASAGYDYVEEMVVRLVRGDLPDSQWDGLARAANAALPLPAANSLLPPGLKIVGPDAVREQLRDYFARVIERSAKLGIRTIVFGSGRARTVPDGFDRKEARQQILDFIRMALPFCAHHDVTLVCEPLNRGECNIINSVAEAMEYVWAIDHPNFQCLVDSYHLWRENEPLENVRDAMPWVRHVHVADLEGRVPPGESGTQDYRPLFAELKRGKYEGGVSVEVFDYPPLLDVAPRVLTFLKKQWAEA